MKRIITYATFFLVAMSLVGCTTRSAYLPKLNFAGPNLAGDQLSFKEYSLVEPNAVGKDNIDIILIIPLVKENQQLYIGRVYNAIENICIENGFDFLTNIKIYQSGWYIPFIFGRSTIKIEGEGWKKADRVTLINNLQLMGYQVSSEVTQ